MWGRMKLQSYKKIGRRGDITRLVTQVFCINFLCQTRERLKRKTWVSTKWGTSCSKKKKSEHKGVLCIKVMPEEMQDLTQSLSSEKRNLIIIFVGVEFVSDLVLRVVKVPALLLLCLVCLVLTHTHKRSLKKRQKLSLPRIQLTTWCLSSFPSPVTLLFLDFLYCFSWSLMFLQMLASSSRGFFLSILSVSLPLSWKNLASPGPYIYDVYLISNLPSTSPSSRNLFFVFVYLWFWSTSHTPAASPSSSPSSPTFTCSALCLFIFRVPLLKIGDRSK